MPDAPPAPPALGTFADLVLARLLPAAKKPPTGAVVQKDVAPLLREPPEKGAVAELAKALKADGLLADPGLTLTPSGRERALAYLRIQALPPTATWGTVRDKYLVPLALGLSVEEGERLSTGPMLAGHLLRRAFDLPIGAGVKTPVDAAVAALVCRLVGFPGCRTFDELAAAAVSREVGERQPPTAKEFKTQRVRMLLGTRSERVGDLRAKALAAAFGPAEPPPPAALDLPEFARRVVAAARACPTGRFDGDKVFISHVWRHLAPDADVRGLGLGGFKSRLAQANQQRLLDLLPADLIQAFDAADVRESATVQPPSTFHFIQTGDAS